MFSLSGLPEPGEPPVPGRVVRAASSCGVECADHPGVGRHALCGRTLLDQAAVQKVRKWEFEPKKIAGIPVTTPVDIPIQFEMERAVASSPTPDENAPPESSQ